MNIRKSILILTLFSFLLDAGVLFATEKTGLTRSMSLLKLPDLDHSSLNSLDELTYESSYQYDSSCEKVLNLLNDLPVLSNNISNKDIQKRHNNIEQIKNILEKELNIYVSDGICSVVDQESNILVRNNIYLAIKQEIVNQFINNGIFDIQLFDVLPHDYKKQCISDIFECLMKSPKYNINFKAKLGIKGLLQILGSKSELTQEKINYFSVTFKYIVDNCQNKCQ